MTEKKNLIFFIKNRPQKFIYSLRVFYRISRNSLGQYFFLSKMIFILNITSHTNHAGQDSTRSIT